MNNSITKKYLINGPNNVVRLSNGKKTIYIFGDIHYDVLYQNECPISDNYDSIDINQFLLEFIKTEKNKSYDLFAEIYNKEIIGNNSIIDNNRYKYIRQIQKLFQSKTEFVNNKIVQNKKYSNFKFHFFDIRNTIPYFYDIFDYNYNIYSKGTKFPFIQYDIYKIKSFTNKLITNSENYLVYLNNKENVYINKILESYTDKDIKNKINEIYNNIIIKNIKNMIENSKTLISFIDSNNKYLKNKLTEKKKFMEIQSEIYLQIENISIIAYDNFTVLTDLFLLRRFLDKDYIQNVITYTGCSHMIDIAYLLVNYFNFELTHVYYNKEKDITKINKLIKKLKTTKNMDHLKTLEKYFLNLNDQDIANQCVNLLEFPNNFS